MQGTFTVVTAKHDLGEDGRTHLIKPRNSSEASFHNPHNVSPILLFQSVAIQWDHDATGQPMLALVKPQLFTMTLCKLVFARVLNTLKKYFHDIIHPYVHPAPQNSNRCGLAVLSWENEALDECFVVLNDFS